MKIVMSATSNSVEVVPDAYGETRVVDGQSYLYWPLPVCRIPIGYGRNETQARALAQLILNSLNAALPGEREPDAAIYGVKS